MSLKPDYSNMRQLTVRGEQGYVLEFRKNWQQWPGSDCSKSVSPGIRETGSHIYEVHPGRTCFARAGMTKNKANCLNCAHEPQYQSDRVERCPQAACCRCEVTTLRSFYADASGGADKHPDIISHKTLAVLLNAYDAPASSSLRRPATALGRWCSHRLDPSA